VSRKAAVVAFVMSLAVSAQPARRAEHVFRLKATAAPLQIHRETLLAVAAVAVAAVVVAAVVAVVAAVVAPALAAAATAEDVLKMGACQMIVKAGSRCR